MANLTITTDTTYKCFRFEFNDTEGGDIPEKIWIYPTDIDGVHIHSSEEIVEAYCGTCLGEMGFSFEANDDGGVIIDSFDAVAPTTLQEVAEILLTIRATIF